MPNPSEETTTNCGKNHPSIYLSTLISLPEGDRARSARIIATVVVPGVRLGAERQGGRESAKLLSGFREVSLPALCYVLPRVMRTGAEDCTLYLDCYCSVGAL